MKYIAHLKDDEIVRRYPMEKDTYSIGRSKDNDLVFDHPKVSRNHAKIFKQNGQYVIQDLNSTNYVFVNGVRIKQKQLEPQDKIQISSDIHLIFGEETGPDPRTNTVVDLHRHFIHKDDLLRLKKVTQSILTLNNLDQILLNILKEGLGLIGAERGFIVMTDGKDQILWKYATMYRIDKEKAEQGEGDISHSILKEAQAQKQTIVRHNGHAPEGSSNPADSMMSLKIYSAMCAPLLLRERVIGLFYADAKQLMNNFTEVDQFLFDYLADQAAIAIVNAKRYADVQTENKRLQQELEAINQAQKSLEERHQQLLKKTGAFEASPLMGKVDKLPPSPTPISHTYSSGGVVLNSLGEVLVVNQQGTSWSLPKGRIEVGEEPAVTAQREIFEESGIAYLRLIRPLSSYQRTALDEKGEEDLHEVKTIYMYLYSTDQAELKPQDPENPEARWVALEEVEKLLTHPKDVKYFQSILPELKNLREKSQAQPQKTE
jgi:pSer/pThr/pTyr-binding forkhead associated (FHA) protein/ADP-ribose pyrophosphatase YjhB (NUDIX family)